MSNRHYYTILKSSIRYRYYLLSDKLLSVRNWIDEKIYRRMIEAIHRWASNRLKSNSPNHRPFLINSPGKVIALFKQGHNIETAAYELKVSTRTLYRYMREHNIKMSGHAHRWDIKRKIVETDIKKEKEKVGQVETTTPAPEAVVEKPKGKKIRSKKARIALSMPPKIDSVQPAPILSPPLEDMPSGPIPEYILPARGKPGRLSKDQIQKQLDQAKIVPKITTPYPGYDPSIQDAEKTNDQK